MTGAAGCGGAGRRPGMRRVLPKAILKTEAGVGLEVIVMDC